MKAVFLRLLEAANKEQALLLSARASEGWARTRFLVDAMGFSDFPRSPFAYWISDRLRRLFTDVPPFESNGTIARRGVNSNDDFRFLRLSWECQPSDQWCHHVKGGARAFYYADPHLAVRWGSDGRELEAERVTTQIYKFAIVPSREHYFRPGLTWSLRTKSTLSFRVMPRGCIFGSKGPAALVPGDGTVELMAVLALGTSSSLRALVEVQLAAADAKPGGAAHSFEVGVIQRTPLANLTFGDKSILADLSHRAWSILRALDASTENSHAFSIPALLQSSVITLAARAAAWAYRISTADAELAAIQSEIDERSFGLYGIDDEDRKAIMEGFGGPIATAPVDKGAGEADSTSGPDLVATRSPADSSDPDDSDESTAADTTALTADLLSWSIGVAFGRFDLRLATGERALPPEPDPFDPLPVCSPGMLTGADGLPCATSPPGYPIDIPQDGVLLDDPGHPRDLTAFARTVFDVVFGGDADARWHEAAGILDPKNHDLRAFVARTFFEQHLKRYSKSRRKAPIYWQLATPSASYSVWLYAHRLTPDTFFHVLHDVVSPKLGLEERKLLSLTQESGPNPTASQRKEIAAEESFVDELRAFRDEVTRVAPLWKPDLDDGVVLTMAPLWRLVPQHRVWQKELKAAWDSLCAGEYDWAHVAMHLWPERVGPKCATDRSLAIAHGLEEAFWEEGAKGKWTARATPLAPVTTLVAAQTSPAAKAALKDLLEAPAAAGAARSGGRGKRRGG